MTPELARIWQAGRLDCRCRDCGAGSAASNQCYRCGSRNLDYVPHAPGQPCLASGRVGRFTSAEQPQADRAEPEVVR